MQEEFEQLRTIIKIVSGFDIKNKSKKTHFVYSRMIFYALTRNRGYTFKMIGEYVGKDHSTVLVGIKQFYNLVTQDSYLRDMYLECSTSFRENTQPHRVVGKMPVNTFVDDLQYQIDSLILENAKLQKYKAITKRFNDILEEMNNRTPQGMEEALSEKIIKILNGDLLR
mgnify:CR=1 FL=1